MQYALIWLGALMLANHTTAMFGPTASIVNSFLLVGLMLTTRDKLHELWAGGRLKWKMGALITAGGALSYLTQPATGSVVTASVVAFVVSETLDAIVYHRTRSIDKSNVVGAFADSIIFPVIAFGGFAAWIFVGQFASKVIGGHLWAALLKRWNVLVVAACLALVSSGAAMAADINVQLHANKDGGVCTTEASVGREVFAFVDYSNEVTYGEAVFTPQLGVINPTAQIEFGTARNFQLPTVGLFGFDCIGLQILYRTDGLLQATYVWLRQSGLVQFTGFVDITKNALIAQPQLWYMIADDIFVGSEVQFLNEDISASLGLKVSM